MPSQPMRMTSGRTDAGLPGKTLLDDLYLTPIRLRILGCRLQAFLGGVRFHDERIVAVGGEAELIERQRNVLLAHAQKSADADDHGVNLTFAVDEDVVDVANLLVGVVHDVLVEQF